MSFVSIFSLLVLVATLALHVEVFRGWRLLRELRDVAPIVPSNAPAVSIVVAARDEADAIEAALRSLLALDYPALEVVAVNDRSTDATGEILDRLKAGHPRLVVLHIDELPPGWLGKNHALHRGAAGARGEYLIFTDADVVFDPSVVRRAVAHCEAERLDHLTIIPSITTRSTFLAMSMMGGFVGLFALRRPWRARETGRHGLGVGAFNMVRAEAFRAAGGHEALAMEVLDDIELGVLMARAHRRQELMLGHGMLSLEMYPSAFELFRGIQKNVFTFLGYSAWQVAGATVLEAAFMVWPWVGAFVTEGPARWACIGAAATATLFYVHLAPLFGYPRRAAAWLPVMGGVTIALIWQVALRTWIQGGIFWRGTFYPLEELKRHRRERGR